MQKILAIALTDLRSEFQSPPTWFTLFIMPIVLTAILATIGGGAPNSRTAILIINEDGGMLASTFLAEIEASDGVRAATALEETPLPATRADALAQIDTYGRVLILPQGFTAALTNGTPLEIPFYIEPTTDAERTQAAQQEIAAILLRVGGNQSVARVAAHYADQLQPFATEAERTDFTNSTLAALQSRQANGGVTIHSTPAGTLPPVQAGGAAQASSGQLVVFALITLLGASQLFVSERQLGTLRRLLTCAVPKWQIIAGKSAGRLAIGIVQITLLIVVGQFVFGVSWGQSPLALALVVLAFSLAALGLGILIATIVRSYEQATQLTIALSLLMGALGGAWWSLEIVQGPLRTVAMLIPTGWAMTAFQSIILRGATPTDVLPNIMALLGFALLFFGVGVSRLKFE